MIQNILKYVQEYSRKIENILEHILERLRMFLTILKQGLADQTTNQFCFGSLRRHITRGEMASRGCNHSPDAFCYICAQFIKTRAKKFSVTASGKIYEAYKAYFAVPVGDQDKIWAPHFACEHCKRTLEGKITQFFKSKIQLRIKNKNKISLTETHIVVLLQDGIEGKTEP